jgi:hypothetical protein
MGGRTGAAGRMTMLEYREEDVWDVILSPSAVLRIDSAKNLGCWK